MANGGRDDNASQFFFTLGRADELNKMNTIFGKVRHTLCIASIVYQCTQYDNGASIVSLVLG